MDKISITLPKLKRTLASDLISKDDSVGYWNQNSYVISRSLKYLPTIDTKYKKNQRCLYGEYNKSKIHSEDIKIRFTNRKVTTDLLISRKIRIQPSEYQKQIFEQLFGIHRYCYNKAVDLYKQGEYPNFINYRNKIVPKNDLLSKEEKWLSKIPCTIRQLAVRKFIGAFNSSLANYQAGNISSFKMRYLTKKDKSGIFCINKYCLTKDLKLCQRSILKTDPNLILYNPLDLNWILEHEEAFDHASSIIKDNTGKYYLCLSYTKERRAIKPKDDIVALDPGCRTFISYYSQNESGKLGKDTYDKWIKPLERRIDDINHELGNYKVPSKIKHNMKRRLALLRSKITHRVNELHRQTALFLVKRYRIILLPKYQVQKMTMKSNNRYCNRSQYALSHFKFRQYLLHKANCFHNRHVILCKENWTTKTCSICGYLNQGMTDEKIYTCPKCKGIIDRDINAARNILIRSITKYKDLGR